MFWLPEKRTRQVNLFEPEYSTGERRIWPFPCFTRPHLSLDPDKSEEKGGFSANKAAGSLGVVKLSYKVKCNGDLKNRVIHSGALLVVIGNRLFQDEVYLAALLYD
ncbi:hypothetical protein RRG08_036308 [Elysia crispata]|uniref:Uncharacterized protein n=1 Tax=Elysia crispata TaxID=231223 RepID=A0AAE0ZNZ7_9GAST|nr:hypothetical protein RRG08_036308 [Elysia crispata]